MALRITHQLLNLQKNTAYNECSAETPEGREIMNNESVSGVFIWQFCDCRVTEEEYWYQSRACMRNNKGVVDRYRRPKLSYDLVKKKFTDNKR